MWTENDTTATPVRSPRRPLPSPTGALLPPRFLPTPAHFTARTGVRGTLSAIGKLRDHRLVQHSTIGLDSEDTIVDCNGADRRARQIPYGKL
jgi:hypothetical protein